jgi:hypothetical protein
MNYQATLKFNQQDYTGLVCSTDHDAVCSAVEKLNSDTQCNTDLIDLIVNGVYENKTSLVYATTLREYLYSIA